VKRRAPLGKAHSANVPGDGSNSRGCQASVMMSVSKSYSAAPPHGFLKYQK